MDVYHNRTTMLWLAWIWLSLTLGMSEAGRYRYCSEGCCPEELCAYRTICYPKTHCLYGCPDGTCEKFICMPPKPCKDNAECAVGNICTINHNLGYNTCQYNLDIGKTLCVDKNGNSLMKPQV